MKKMNPSRKIGMLLPRVMNLKTTICNRVLAKTGLTHSVWVALNVIGRNPGQSTHALAEMCMVTDQSFGQLVAKLADQGWIERKPGFGKAILHELTDAGRQVLAKVVPLMEETLREFFSPLNRREQEMLAEMLERLIRESGPVKMPEALPPELSRG